MAVKKKVGKYSDEFREKALARLDKGEPVAVVAADLKIYDSLLYGWRSRRLKMSEEGSKPNPAAQMREAIILLQKAKDAMTKDLRAGKIKTYSRSQLLMLLALDALTGGAA